MLRSKILNNFLIEFGIPGKLVTIAIKGLTESCSNIHKVSMSDKLPISYSECFETRDSLWQLTSNIF